MSTTELLNFGIYLLVVAIFFLLLSVVTQIELIVIPAVMFAILGIAMSIVALLSIVINRP